MSIIIIKDAGTNPYNQANKTTKTDSTGEEFQNKVMKCTSAGNQKVSVCSDALMSYASPQTGESVNIYKAENYSADNPLYVIKGLDANGDEFEQVIDASKISPNKCSYNELMVLNIENGRTSPSDFFRGAVARGKSGTDSYFDKADYIASIQEVMEEQKTLKNWDSYLGYDKWLQSLIAYASKNNNYLAS